MSNDREGEESNRIERIEQAEQKHYPIKSTIKSTIGSTSLCKFEFADDDIEKANPSPLPAAIMLLAVALGQM